MFQRLSDLDLDMSASLTHSLRGHDALDIERGLCLSTTNGRTRNARRWFVNKMNSSGGIDWDAGKVTFRAWTLSEALERLNEPRLSKRVDKLAATAQQAPANGSP